MTSDVNAMWLPVFHLLTGLHHAYTISRMVTVDYDGVSHPYMLVTRDMGFRFLTVWNLILQCLYFGMCGMEIILDANIEGSNPLVRRYKKTRDTIFRALVFPIALLVTSVFWILFTLDRDLVYPAIVDQYLPPHVNQMMHTSISIAAVLELVLRPHQYRRLWTDITILLLFNCSYLFCYQYTYWTRGVWMYPVYKYLSWNQQQLMNLMLGFVVPIAYYLLAKATAIKLHGTGVHHLNGTKKET
ncbi:androgen-dependent TFPI-regulating protein-like isoform X2 [Periplaneta americana]|uniref:androgen-dependent TFPI-regulating protein-like isoform X2 n=1 Tax=Periplaneta americana TaxID=6978 RepID=UPI0037E8E843